MTFGSDAIEMLREATLKLEQYVRYVQRKVDLLLQQLSVYQEWKSRITSTTPIPGTENELVIVKSPTAVSQSEQNI